MIMEIAGLQLGLKKIVAVVEKILDNAMRRVDQEPGVRPKAAKRSERRLQVKNRRTTKLLSRRTTVTESSGTHLIRIFESVADSAADHCNNVLFFHDSSIQFTCNEVIGSG